MRALEALGANLLFYQARIESSLALNPRSRRIVSSTPCNRSISVRLLAPTLAILRLLGLRAAPLKVTGDAYDYYQRAHNPSKLLGLRGSSLAHNPSNMPPIASRSARNPRTFADCERHRPQSYDF